MKEIQKGYLGFVEGMLVGPSQERFKGGSREVDWGVVKQFIELNKNKLRSVEVGLAEDWSYTSGEVWNNEEGYIKSEDTYVHASSIWATPSMEIELLDGSMQMFEVWKLGNNPDSYFE